MAAPGEHPGQPPPPPYGQPYTEPLLPVGMAPQHPGPQAPPPGYQPGYQQYPPPPYPNQPQYNAQGQLMVPMKPPQRPEELLEKIMQVFVKQKPQYLENMGCEFENEYTVYKGKGEKGKGKPRKGCKLFTCKEKSGCFERQCLSSNCRPFRMKIEAHCRNLSGKKHKTPFLVLERPFACTCLCCNRPFMRVICNSGENEELLGFVTDPFACCDYTLNVIQGDSHEAPPLYKIQGSCCQCGLLFHCPCGPCREIKFPIRDVNKNHEIGEVSKVFIYIYIYIL